MNTTVLLDRCTDKAAEKKHLPEPSPEPSIDALARLALVENHRANVSGLLTREQRIEWQQSFHNELVEAGALTKAV